MNLFFAVMPLRIAIFALVVWCACGCYDNHNDSNTPFSEVANFSIAELRELGAHGCYTIDSEKVSLGRITSSDSEGNFYRSLFLEDESGGAEILLGTYNTSSQYPIGLLVALHLNGMAVMVEDGVLRVGLPPQKHDSAPRDMEAQSVIDAHLVRSQSVEEPQPTICKIEDLHLAMCGRFVRIEGLEYSAPNSKEGDTLEGYRAFADSEGKLIYSSVSEYATFADMAIPTENISLQGILSYEAVGGGAGRQYTLKPRSKDDFTLSHSHR